MPQAMQLQALHRLFEPLGQCLTYEVAQQIAALRAPDDVQTRFDYLADRNTEGLLDSDERAEYESLVSGLSFISILQAKARGLLAQADPHP